eukprot:jgi/Chlat1/8989/Chrsp94S08278
MVFWGKEIKPGESYQLEPLPVPYSRLHVSQATLGFKENEKANERVVLKCQPADEDAEEVLICSLRSGQNDTCSLDLNFEEPVTFTVQGNNSIHLAGYCQYPDSDEDEDHDTDDESDEERLTAGDLRSHFLAMDDEADEDEDEDEDEEDEDEDEDTPVARSSKEPKDLRETIAKMANKRGALTPEGGNKKAKLEAGKSAANGTPAKGSEQNNKQTPKTPAQQQPGNNKKDAKTPQGAKTPAGQDQKPSENNKTNGANNKTPAKDAKTPAKDAKTPAAGKDAKTPAKDAQTPASGKKPSVRKFPNGLEIEDIAMGKPDGKLAKPGTRVTMNYTGKLKTGKIFDTSVGKKPFTFRLGVGEVIKGWDVGVQGMRVGDKRKLTIPPQMAYGAEGVKGTIPGNATLLFDVELVSVK